MKKNILFVVMAFSLMACTKSKQVDQVTAEDVQVSDVQNQTILSQDVLIQEAKSKPLTNVVLTENHWDFKEVKKGESVEHNYEITNTGENPLIISHVKPGCGCTAPEYTKEPILPGQKGVITLKFDSSSFDGLQNKQAEVYANVENAPIVISFSANVIN